MSAQAFSGVKVVEFAAFAAGPMVGKHLGDHGARVVHVESFNRPDGFRTQYPPFKDNQPGINRSGCFGITNNNKYGVALDLKVPGQFKLAQRLAAWADVIIENFTPGTMKRLGLDYEELTKIKPDLIMLSTCNQGQTGPHAQHPGFGSHLSSLSGFTNLTGYPDKTPLPLYGPYIDYIAVGYGVIAVAAALDYRRRTKKGQYIDLSQYETGLNFIGPALLDFFVNGRVAQRMGNRHPCSAPHGVYPCKSKDEWCALGVYSDEEWETLKEVMGFPAWAAEESFSTFLGRKENEAELDTRLSQWTCNFTKEEIFHLLQKAGLSGGKVNTVKELFEDPQLNHRKVWVELPHPEMEKQRYEGPPFILSETPANLRLPAPCLGEHNRYVFLELLGMCEEEYNRLMGAA